MGTEVSRSPARSRRGLFGLACFGLGMLAMWGWQNVDVRSLFRSGASTEDELARAAFEALSDGDFEDFDEYVPKLEDFEKYIARIREVGTDRDRKRVDRKLKEDGGASRAVEESRANVRASFADTIDRARRAGLDWRAAEYGGLNRHRTRIKERFGWRGGDIHFFVRSGDKTFDFELDGCICLDGAWMVGNRVRLVRPRDGARDDLPPAATRAVPDKTVAPPAAGLEATPAPDAVEAAVSEAVGEPVSPRADAPPKRQR
jgi:hypothetical protein